MNSRRQFIKKTGALAAASVGVSFTPINVLAREFTQVAAVRRFQVGDTTVTALSDGYISLSAEIMQGVTEDEFSQLLVDAHLKAGTSYRGAVNAFLLERGDAVKLIDTGTGNAFGPSLGKLSSNLDTVGVDTNSVNSLLVTHLHPDHIGGLLGDTAMKLPAAGMVVTEADRAFWSNNDIKASAPDSAKGFFDMAQAALSSFDDRLNVITGETALDGGIAAVPLPGHTPGHTGYRIDDGDESLLIWGDIMHVPPVQLAKPDVTIAFDTDAELAAKSRKKILDQVAADGTMVAGMHMPFPGIGYIEKAGSGYNFIPATWEYTL